MGLDDYTVACICPLGIELAAVIGMLDAKHPDVSIPRDQNAYTFGNIGEHNLVIAVLPHIGTNAAARVATQLLNDFQSVRFGLLVGIGGGVPGDDDDHDIRLGDVVVGMPTDRFPGVVQYDLGKKLGGGGFERTGHLNKPPELVASMVNKLRAEHLVEGSRIMDYIADMFQRHPKMRSKFSIPSSEPDKLFLASYPHQSGGTCRGCDSHQTVPRGDRSDTEPQIHYGTIGSANAVVKDPKVRDSLRKDMDAHTHKLLQESNQIARRSMELSAESLQNSVRQWNTGDQRKCLLQAFRTSPYEQYKNINPKRAEKTCKWVLDRVEFHAWQQSTHNDLLWISADPGCGKSVLSKSLVDCEFNDVQSHNVCYFFFKRNQQQENLSTALCAILHQLFRLQPELLDHALPLWHNNGMREGAQQDTDELWRIFTAAAMESSTRSTICILDALDECQDRDRQQLIEKLCQFYKKTSKTPSTTPLKFLVTSRPYYNVQYWLSDTSGSLPEIRLSGENENDTVKGEINLVIDQYIGALTTEFSLPSDVERSLRKSLKAMKQRTYLWLHLAMEGIRETCAAAIYPEDIVIESLPQSVEDAYERVLSKITTKQKSNAQKILMIIVGARRPLTVAEMAFALSADRADNLQQSQLDIIDISGLQNRIRQLCGLFVFIDHSRIFLIHETAAEFLVAKGMEPTSSTPRLWKSCFQKKDVELQMARLCVTYLLLCPKRWRPSRDESHCYDCLHSRVSGRAMVAENPEHVIRMDAHNAKQFFTYSITGHAFALEGISHSFVDKLEAKDDTGRTALQWAVNLGHTEVAERLLIQGANINARGISNRDNILLNEILQHHSEMVLFLLDHGADANVQNGEYGLPLGLAASAGCESVVELLLKHGADINAGTSHPALYYAAAEGHGKTVKILLARTSDILGQRAYESALQVACRKGHRDVVQILLDNGADPNFQRAHSNTVLQLASRRGYTDIVRVLLAKDADVNARGGFFDTALQAASVGGFREIVRLLLDKGADVNAKGGRYGNAVQAASRGGHQKVVKILLENGANNTHGLILHLTLTAFVHKADDGFSVYVPIKTRTFIDGGRVPIKVQSTLGPELVFLRVPPWGLGHSIEPMGHSKPRKLLIICRNMREPWKLAGDKVPPIRPVQ
ncbi:hypothetical protein FE257_008072 [Aspergillus nanangensis]|uniref:Uncharacterized protein n=1 Tax=Aspergillus nanangensis TaxID=2582783 RepID=A0AAD4CM79_ASPNN|nr:hypothetical protein FE257_008072 [Aspergillus nanangensis]